MRKMSHCIKTFFIILMLIFASSTLPNGVIIVFGTRPECIKIAPVYKALKQRCIPVYTCLTGQHANLIEDSLDVFDINLDINLNIMKPEQDLFYLTSIMLDKLKDLFLEKKPSLVIVQGDTTTAMSAALAAFYYKIPVAHIEAGLRTNDINFPFPEELNRRIISLIASLHFAPTKLAEDKLLSEGVLHSKIFNLGNTVVDSLFYIQGKLKRGEITPSNYVVDIVRAAKEKKTKLFLLTAHRRESLFSDGLGSIFRAFKKALEKFDNMSVIYPIHPNPKIKQLIEESGLNICSNIIITKPLSYIDIVYLLTEVDVVFTDSGGIQEEAISLSKPLFVLRNETERQEGIIAGISKLIGTKKEVILEEISNFMQYGSKALVHNNIYGSGNSGDCIAEIIERIYFE